MNLQAIQTLLFELIAIDTTSVKSNEPMIACLESHLQGADIEVHRVPSSEEGKYNLLAIKGEPSASGDGLTLCGHVDTVPADPRRWQSDPWTLTEREGRWYARGACDMKGFVAVAVHVLLNASVQRAPLALLLTCDEEVGSLGANHIATFGTPMDIPRQVIIGEPTSLRVVRLHKGHLSMQVTIEGVSAHTGSPHLGKNAAVAGGSVISALANLSAVMESERTPESEHFEQHAAFPVLTVATVSSGKAINIVPDTCTIGLGLRLLPNQDRDDAIGRIRQVIVGACNLPWTLTISSENPSMCTTDNAPIHTWLTEVLEQQGSIGVSFGTDGGYLSNAGYECVLFGPGDIAIAHRPDEFVPIDEIDRCAKILEETITYFCGGTP